MGSTGSIGTQALDVVDSSPDRFRVVALGAHRSVELLAAQARRLRPEVVAIGDASLAGELADRLPPGIEVLAGPDGLAAIATVADVAVNGVVGFAGLPVTLAALEAGRRLALANKESLIAGAPVVQRARATPGAEIVPVDSEHCALHQCLRAGRAEDVARLLLTASGGPFRGRSAETLRSVGVAEALSHPTWAMGPKITVDSSTLMNKGLEVIEAHELFGVPYDAIDVVVHPQSIVHSMVEFVDGAVVAQLSMPDMRLPIGYALTYPDRLPTAFGAIDWAELSLLEFEPPDRATFPCLDLAYQAGRAGDLAPAWLNAANEVAVAAFLSGRISWGTIAEVVEGALDRYDAPSGSTVGTGPRSGPPSRESRTCSRPTPPPVGWPKPPCRAGGGGMSTTVTRLPEEIPVDPIRSGPPPGSMKSPRRLAGELLAAIAAIVLVAVVTGYVDLLIVVVSIIVIVMIHELGHFLAAKHGGMKVTEYFVGFGPRLWSFRRGETEYGIKALPLGGYVKIPGMTNLEEVDPADEARTYREQPFHARLLVAVAGSAMHFLMAFVLLWALLTFVGLPNANQVEIQGLSQVGNGPGPAQVAGLRPGDIVVSVDGKPVGGNVDALTSAIQRPSRGAGDRGGRPGRASDKTLTVTPANGRTAHEKGAVAPPGSAPFGIIGVSLGSPVQTTGRRCTGPRPVRSSGTSCGHRWWGWAISSRPTASPSGSSRWAAPRRPARRRPTGPGRRPSWGSGGSPPTPST